MVPDALSRLESDTVRPDLNSEGTLDREDEDIFTQTANMGFASLEDTTRRLADGCSDSKPLIDEAPTAFTTVIGMSEDFQRKVKDGYKQDATWRNRMKMLQDKDHQTRLAFCLKEDLIY